MKHGIIIFIVLAAALAAVACAGDEDAPLQQVKNDNSGAGIFHGRVEFAPLCPVEPCGEDIYSSQNMVLQQEGGAPISVPLNADGTFESPVPVGTYSIHLADCTHVSCQELFPLTMPIEAGENPAFNIQLDMGDRTLASSSQTALLSKQLQAAGASVEPGAPIVQAMFSVPGQNLSVNGVKLQVFEYSSDAEAKKDMETVSPDGSSIGTVSMLWMTPPHFYHKGTLIALYIGEDAELLRIFEDSLGPQFVEGFVADSGPTDPVLGGVSSRSRSVTLEVFQNLLALEDLTAASQAADLDLEIIDFKERAAQVNPSQVQNMHSWYGLTVSGGGGLTMTVMDFDSLSAAESQYELLTAEGLLAMDTAVGDRSAGVELNDNGIGSMLVFMQGKALVSLHTAQGADPAPLVTQAGLEELGKLVASRLGTPN
jgi:hypothetical protein